MDCQFNLQSMESALYITNLLINILILGMSGYFLFGGLDRLPLGTPINIFFVRDAFAIL